MIRMGKSSNDNESNETNQSSTNAFPANRNTYGAQGQPVSESEMMARDIKEGKLSGFVGGGTVLTGETTFEAMLRVDGHLKGSVTSEDGTLIVGATGKVDADIIVAQAMVSGEVNGDISASEKLTLGRTAKVVGNIQAPRLIIEDGAILEGGCKMLESKDALETRIEESQISLTSTELSSDTENELEADEEDDYDSVSLSEEEEEDDADEDEEETAEAAAY